MHTQTRTIAENCGRVCLMRSAPQKGRFGFFFASNMSPLSGKQLALPSPAKKIALIWPRVGGPGARRCPKFARLLPRSVRKRSFMAASVALGFPWGLIRSQVNSDIPLSTSFTDSRGFAGQLRPEMLLTDFCGRFTDFHGHIPDCCGFFTDFHGYISPMGFSWPREFLSRLAERVSKRMNSAQVCLQVPREAQC